MKTATIALLLAAVPAFGSCRTHYDLVVRADPGRLNPSPESESNAVTVQFFHLKTRGRFDEAAWPDLWDPDTAESKLGDSWDRSESVSPITLIQAQASKIKVPVVDGVQFLGVMARYDAPKEGDTTKDVIPFDELESYEVVLHDTTLKKQRY